jgi:hypothetical protein
VASPANLQPFVLGRKPPQTSSDDERDFAPRFVETHRIRVTPGRYTMRCIGFRPRHMFGGHKLELKFQIPGTEDCVFAYLHLGRGPEPEVTPGSNYAKLWREVTGDKKASPRRMSAKMFKWSWFECHIDDCTRAHDGKVQQPYSRVKQIVRFLQR